MIESNRYLRGVTLLHGKKRSHRFSWSIETSLFFKYVKMPAEDNRKSYYKARIQPRLQPHEPLKGDSIKSSNPAEPKLSPSGSPKMSGQNGVNGDTNGQIPSGNDPVLVPTKIVTVKAWWIKILKFVIIILWLYMQSKVFQNELDKFRSK